MRLFSLFICILLPLVALKAGANDYPLPEDGGTIVGSLQYHRVQPGESLNDIANQYHVGLLALMAINKGVDPFLPDAGSQLTIPTKLILPDVPWRGIVINLAELRLYYFPPDKKSVQVYPIGIGRIGRATPEMSTYVSVKRDHPTWTPTANIRKEYLEKKGIELPQSIPAGPDNPLGEYALRLAYGSGEYLIHGTNKSFGIGMRVSSGCIRMHPQDIERMFNQVRVGTPVRVINQPVKSAIANHGELYLEVHEPLSRDEEDTREFTEVNLDGNQLQLVSQPWVDTQKVAFALKSQAGIPIWVGYAVTQDIASQQ